MKNLSYEEVKSIPSLFEKLVTREAVAKKLGVTASAVDKWIARLRKAGYKVKIKRGRKPIKL